MGKEMQSPIDCGLSAFNAFMGWLLWEVISVCCGSWLGQNNYLFPDWSLHFRLEF